METSARNAWSMWVWRVATGLLLAILCVQMFAQGDDISAAALTPTVAPTATCAQLAAMSPTATNGPAWGKSLLIGFDVTHGWFGVPVCANYYNQFTPGGANVSCTRAPTAGNAAGCAPGAATSDGYGLTFQCVELVARFAKWAYGDAPSGWRGDAPYLWLNGNHPADFKAFANGGIVAPVPGDVLVWGSLDSKGAPWPAGPAGGHVAVVDRVSANAISFVEENMLGHQNGVAFNIPRERTTLTRTSNGGWLVGATYGENGGRTLYGWLHSSRNTGRFPSVGGVATPSPAQSPATTAPAPTVTPTASVTPTVTPTPTPPVTLPSLAQGVVITGSGALAQVVWSDTHSPLHPAPVTSAEAAGVRLVVESLGAPAGVVFAPTQTPAVVSLPTGECYVFARGNDGALYSAYTAPEHPEPYWQFLGSPTGVKLTTSISAIWDQSGMVVGALGDDGAFWLRAGPSGALGDWVSIGAPAHTAFIGTPALATGPQAAPSPAVTRVAFALGHDGALYESDWSASEWTPWAQAPIDALSASLIGGLRIVSEPSANGAALDVIATDATDHLWLLRRASLTQPWTATSTPLPSAHDSVIGAVLATQVAPAPEQANGSAATPPGLTVYTAIASSAATAAHIEQVTLPVSGAISAQWRPLDGEIASASPPTALTLGAYGSGLLTTTNTAVSLFGPASLLHVLLPTAQPSGLSYGMELGQIPAPGSFDDSFASATVNPQWVIRGSAQAPATESDGALTLWAPLSAAQQSDIAQASPPGSFTVTTHVAPSADWNTVAANPAQPSAEAGIQLALDDWNSLSLGVQSGEIVALCPRRDGASMPCSEVATPTNGATEAGVYLRISVADSTCTGEVSRDGRTWTKVGAWTPSWLPSGASEFIGPYAPSLATPNDTTESGAAHPQSFTTVRLYVTRNAPATQPDTRVASARFGDFTIRSEGSASAGQ